MDKSILKLETYTNGNSPNAFRTVFQNRHGRRLFLALEINVTDCMITNCFYIDRNQGKTGPKRCSARPRKLQTFHTQTEHLLSVIETELDKKFYGMEYIHTGNETLPLDQYLQAKSESSPGKYRFLIMVGEGERYNGLPVRLRTRLKNKTHRLIFIELAYYKDGQGVVKQCCYYDRPYKRQDIQITPPFLTSCFFPYTREGIRNLINNEICCNFTHMIVADGIDLDSNITPVCGAI